MDNEKLQINLAPGMSKAELVIREGAAPKELEPKAPVKTNLKGVIGAVVEYLKKRINAGQFEQKDCHILVNRDTIEITLITNEADEYRRGEITGKYSIFIESYSFEYVFIQSGCNVWKGFETLREMFAKANGGKYSKAPFQPDTQQTQGRFGLQTLESDVALVMPTRWHC